MYVTYPRIRWEEPGYTIDEHTGSPSPYWSFIDTIVIHYPGCKSCCPTPPVDQNDVIAKTRNTQRWYADSKGYSLGYNWLVDKDGGIIESRGHTYANAANYSTYKGRNENYYSISIQIHANGDDSDGHPADAATLNQVLNVRAIIADVAERCTNALTIIGHQDTKSTSCPGCAIYKQIYEDLFNPNQLPQEDLDMQMIVPPLRILDTRKTSSGPVEEDMWIDVAVPPQHTSAAAVFVNLTTTGAVEPGYLTAWSGEGPRPNVSNVNYSGPKAECNTSWVPLRNGKFRIYTRSQADIIVDLQAIA